MVSEQYQKLMWGLILVLLDIRFNNFNLTPDFIGYAVASAALGRLRVQHEFYSRAQKYAAILIAVSLPEMFRPVGDSLAFSNLGIFLMFLDSIYVILNLLMINYICQAIVNLAKETSFLDLYQTASFRWELYLLANSAAVFLIPFQLNINPGWSWPVVIPGLAAFIMQILLILLVRQAGILLTPTGPDHVLSQQ